MKAREALASCLNGSEYARTHPTFAKDILTVALNLDKPRHLAKLRRQRMFFNVPIVIEMLTIIDRAKPDIVAQAIKLGFNNHGDRINANNIVYFALEFVEGAFMRTFIASMLRSVKVTSMVWVHDGILMSPEPAHFAITNAAQEANAQLQNSLKERTGASSSTVVVVGLTRLEIARQEIIKFIAEGCPQERVGPRPAISQEPVHEYVYEYDYFAFENLREFEHADGSGGKLSKPLISPKRKLPIHDSSGILEHYFKRQRITSAS